MKQQSELLKTTAVPFSGELNSFPKHPNQSKWLIESSVSIKSIYIYIKKH